jgi:hypothetical protein
LAPFLYGLGFFDKRYFDGRFISFVTGSNVGFLAMPLDDTAVLLMSSVVVSAAWQAWYE